MAEQEDLPPIIVKRKKVAAKHEHHGGAWKVAYADFVTAMMAFFLLMWLVNSTTATQRRGLANYFSPSIPMNPVSGGGDGALGGNSPFSTEDKPHDGAGATQEHATQSDRARGETGMDPEAERAQQDRDLQRIEDVLFGRGGESLLTENDLRHVTSKITDKGLEITIKALPGAPLFRGASSDPTRVTQTLVSTISRVFDRVSNSIEIGGHVRAVPIVMSDKPVWIQSSGRADRVRRMMVGFGTDTNRMQRVVGHADRDHSAENPMDVRNNRIEITLLRGGKKS